jgi:hypothetical protein
MERCELERQQCRSDPYAATPRREVVAYLPVDLIPWRLLGPQEHP